TVEELVTNPHQILWFLLRQWYVGSNPGVTKKILTDRDKRLQCGQEQQMLSGNCSAQSLRRPIIPLPHHQIFDGNTIGMKRLKAAKPSPMVANSGIAQKALEQLLVVPP